MATITERLAAIAGEAANYLTYQAAQDDLPIKLVIIVASPDPEKDDNGLDALCTLSNCDDRGMQEWMLRRACLLYTSPSPRD